MELQLIHKIINNTNITATGKNNYGIYSAGYVVNNGNMNLSAGTGNVGVYSVNGGTIENISGAITVGGSVPVNDEYGIKECSEVILGTK